MVVRKITAAFIFLFFFLSNSSAQEKRFGLELNYPIPLGDNFINSLYTGIADIGMNYKVMDNSGLDIGLLFNVNCLKLTRLNVENLVFFLQPKVLVSTDIGDLTPYLGIGYSLYSFLTGNRLYHDFEDRNEDDTKDGPSINIGLKYRVSSKLYINTNFNYTKLRHENSWMQNSSYNRNIQMMNLGFGLLL